MAGTPLTTPLGDHISAARTLLGLVRHLESGGTLATVNERLATVGRSETVASRDELERLVAGLHPPLGPFLEATQEGGGGGLRSFVPTFVGHFDRVTHQLLEADRQAADRIRKHCAAEGLPEKVGLSLTDVLDHPERWKGKIVEIVAFDFDGTVRRGQLWGGLFYFYLRGGLKTTIGTLLGPKLLPLAWRIVKHAIRDLVRNNADEQGIQDLTTQTLRDLGLSRQALEQATIAYAEEFARRGLSPYVVGLIDTCRWLHGEPDTNDHLVLICTASPTMAVRHLAEHLHLPSGNIQGTDVLFNESGKSVDARVMRHTVKTQWIRGIVQRLSQAGVVVHLKLWGADTRSDHPTACEFARFGGIPLLVNGGDELGDEYLQMGAAVVDERRGKVTIAVMNKRSEGEPCRHTQLVEETARLADPSSPSREDMSYYARTALEVGATFALAVPVASAVVAAASGTFNLSETVANLPGEAVGAGLWGATLGSLGTHLLPPSLRHLMPERRYWVYERMLPLLGATGFFNQHLGVTSLALAVYVAGVAIGGGISTSVANIKATAGARRLLDRLIPLASTGLLASGYMAYVASPETLAEVAAAAKSGGKAVVATATVSFGLKIINSLRKFAGRRGRWPQSGVWRRIVSNTLSAFLDKFLPYLLRIPT